MLNQLLGDVSGLVPPISANIQITYTAERVALLSEIDQTVHLTGDVRDQHIMLSAGVPKSRALTAEGNGWVAVNSERYPRPA